jgi:hypothetical protein
MTQTTKARGGRRNTGRDRIISAGLAGATCLGVVGVVGVRTIEANAAQAKTIDLQVASTPLDTPATSTSGLTQEQLDAYAAQLAAEKAQLDAYRTKLTRAAKQLQAAANSQSGGSRAVAAVSTPRAVTAVPAKPQPVAKPKAAPAPKAATAPKPAPKPQSNTKGS